MKFDWDEEKNEENIRKHGFDFSDAPEVFDGPRLQYFDTRFDYNELRYITIGFSNNRVVVVAFIEETDITRLISMRKANAKEKKKFKDRLGKR